MDETQDHRPRSPLPGDRLYLLVVEGNSSIVFPLPRNGSVSIGRAPTSDIPIDDPAASRNHAKVVVTDGEARVVDLESHNGVQLNGSRVDGSQPLHSGDLIRLGNVTLVFHRGERPVRRQPLLEAGPFRARLSQELDRLRSREGELAVLAVAPGTPAPVLDRLAEAAGDGLRLMDALGAVGGSLMVMLPELTGEEAANVGASLLEAVHALAPDACAGLAGAPRDGLDVEALIASAREASEGGKPGEVRITEPASYRLQLGHRTVLVADSSTRATYDLLRRLAASELPVLVLGETGVGKENAAWAVHALSRRRDGPFQVLNCAALTETLAESLLFGHERGAFTGANRAQTGKFEAASHGTLFLDEVGELPLSIQPKFLRALEEKTITRLGETRERKVDVRIVAATNRNLGEEVKAGRFRQDLFHRIKGATVELAPLRDRRRELPLLARAFLEEECAKLERGPLELSAAAMDALGAHAWPGNVRELRNAMAYAASTAGPGPIVEPWHLPRDVGGQADGGDGPAGGGAPGGEQGGGVAPAEDGARHAHRTFRPVKEAIRELERQAMVEAMDAAGGVLNRAAQLIGMPLRTFMYKLKQYRIARPR